jgi:HAMP domain-containing protein
MTLPPGEVLSRGTLVGEYRIVGRQAVGGMGAVYEARHPLIGKNVAIKVILGRLSKNLTAVQRFVDEARAVNRIGHPNIVDIFSFGTLDDGRCYIVMEWLEGESLHERMMRGFLGLAPTIEILTEVADALAAAHGAGVIHRDLKPANIQLVRRGDRESVKLLDFGIAKLSEHVEQAVALGTPEFISPEQARGEEVDGATDIYALGAMAYALFVGKLPFYHPDPRVLIDLQIAEPVTPPSVHWPEIPKALDRLIVTMLAKDRADRPSLDEVKRGLGQIDRARMLGETFARGFAARSKRPMLVRDFADVPSMLARLMEELSSGVVWVVASGEPPRVGSPATIRFRVDDHGLAVDLPGLFERSTSAPDVAGQKVQPRSLVRFDRVPAEEMSRIAAARASLSTKGGRGEIGARWGSVPRDEVPWFDAVPPEWRKRADSGRSAAPTAVLLRAKKAPPAPAPEEGTLDLPREAPAPRPAFLTGLRMKVLLVMVSLAAASVAAVMLIAIGQVQEDRAYYFEELSVRTSLYLADMLRARAGWWRAELQTIATGAMMASASKEFAAVADCAASGCSALSGEGGWAAHAPGTGFRLSRHDRGVVASIADDRRTVLGLVSHERLIEAGRLPSYLSLWFVRGDGEVLSSTGPRKASTVLLEGLDRSSPGSKPFADADGEPMIGAWSGGDPAIAVAVPMTVASRAIERLTQQLLGAMAIVLAVASAVALVFAGGVTRRLRILTAETARIGRGEFTNVPGSDSNDEVGHLARSFQSMTEALRERDDEVREIHRRMSQAEAKEVQKQLAESLETELAQALHAMGGVLDADLEERDAARDLRQRRAKLEALHAKAADALQRALALTTIVNRRIDFAAAVQDAVDYVRRSDAAAGARVDVIAPNAVLFPRLDVRESELRELVGLALGRFIEGCGAERAIAIHLGHREQALAMSIRYPEHPKAREVVEAIHREIEPSLAELSAIAVVRSEGPRTTLVLGFAVGMGEGT